MDWAQGVFPESSITELTRFLRKMIYSILLVAGDGCKQGESVLGPAAVDTWLTQQNLFEAGVSAFEHPW